MDKKAINSFGSIVIPISIRKELGINGNMMLWVDTREYEPGKKEIVLRVSDSTEELLSKYRTWSEVIASIAECSVALVYNNTVLSMSTGEVTESFIGKGIIVSQALSIQLKKLDDGEMLVNDNPKMLEFIEGMGSVSAICKIRNTGSDNCYFVIVKGTKYQGDKVTKKIEQCRYENIKKILNKI